VTDPPRPPPHSPHSPPKGSEERRPDFSVELPADLAAVERGLDAVRRHLAPYCVDEGCAYNAELVFEELFTNVVRHAFRGESGHRINVSMRVGVDTVALEFMDDGPPFDPTTYESEPPPTRLEEARVGGLGLTLVRTASRAIEYARRDGRNLVRVTLAR
jgi:anti-sigma regulatory factor (Ser/Thr protein kinase)